MYSNQLFFILGFIKEKQDNKIKIKLERYPAELRRL